MTNRHPGQPDPQAPAPGRPVLRYDVAGHVLRISLVSEGRWAVAIDEQPMQGTFPTRADAWEAGVREADRRDRPAGTPGAPGVG